MVLLGVNLDEVQLKEYVADCILELFVGSKIIEYNAAKWIGFDESLDCWLQHHAVNQLGLAAWNRMLGRPDFYPEHDPSDPASCAIVPLETRSDVVPEGSLYFMYTS